MRSSGNNDNSVLLFGCNTGISSLLQCLKQLSQPIAIGVTAILGTAVGLIYQHSTLKKSLYWIIIYFTIYQDSVWWGCISVYLGPGTRMDCPLYHCMGPGDSRVWPPITGLLMKIYGLSVVMWICHIMYTIMRISRIRYMHVTSYVVHIWLGIMQYTHIYIKAWTTYFIS